MLIRQWLINHIRRVLTLLLEKYKKLSKKIRPYLVNVFRFPVFKGKRKKKTKFFYFQNEKHVCLVERKNTFSKNKIQEICLVVVFEKVEFCFLWLNFLKKNYIYSNSKTCLLQSI